VTDHSIEILLVEDNPNDVKLTMHAFKKMNLANQIHVVRDGAEALDFVFCRAQYAGRQPDCHPRLILLDLKLPKVDGLEVLRALKSDPRTRSIPVVILTSSREEQDMIKGYSLGANSYVRKPVDFNEFAEAVRQLGLYWLVINEAAP
jgi:two-component system response regulator